MDPESQAARVAGGDLPEAIVEDLVGDPRRRILLDHLAERDEPVALTDLAAAVRASEDGCAPADVPAERRRATLEGMLETDLPKLTATGVVEYDSMRGTVTLQAEAVAEQMD